MTSVPLDNIAHAGWRLIPGHGARFGDAVNQVAVFASEFRDAARHYPLLLRREANGGLQAVAILGLARDENLFVDEPAWDADYIPALLRRGPFRIVLNGDDAIVEIEPDHPRVVQGGDDGVPLFLPHGGHAPALEAAVDALRSLHVGLSAADEMTRLFDAHDLVQPVELTLTLGEGEEMSFEGFLAVSEERLATLDGAAVEALNRAGLLVPAIHAAGSLDRFRGLIERHLSRRAAA